MCSVVNIDENNNSGNYGNSNSRISWKRSTFVLRAELFWRELGRNITVCPKYEIASGLNKNAKNIFCLAADATRKVVTNKLAKL